MNILPETNDADGFIAQVDALANGLLLRYTPESLILIKVSSWFGSRWLGFSGKALGIVGVHRVGVGGVWQENNLSVPPFIPSRIVSQRKIRGTELCGSCSRLAASQKGEKPRSRTAANRSDRARCSCPLVQRKLEDYRTRLRDGIHPSIRFLSFWYASWAYRDIWHVEETIDISHQELSFLADSAGLPVN